MCPFSFFIPASDRSDWVTQNADLRAHFYEDEAKITAVLKAAYPKPVAAEVRNAEGADVLG